MRQSAAVASLCALVYPTVKPTQQLEQFELRLNDKEN